jgi:16S rRNA (adenine1518-N6/adenine1519-N6)-dimethyltransferase
MNFITPKKSLGQHFLTDENIARKIVNSLSNNRSFSEILEIGPGMGILSKYLLGRKEQNVYFIEKDRNAYEYLVKNFPSAKDKIILADFLDYDLNEIFPFQFAVIGNFPYNISTQILFRVLEFRNRIPEVVGMFQKEVAQRIASKPNNKTYGILSVLLQAFYDIEYMFTVNETVFYPPPNVKSAVIKLTRNNKTFLDCDEELFFEVVKTAFNQRRKMLRNGLKPFGKSVEKLDSEILTKRPENLSVTDFILLSKTLSQ